MVFRAAEDCGLPLVAVVIWLCDVKLKLTPMLIKAIMTRIDRENMIELSGMGVPRFVTCYTLVG